MKSMRLSLFMIAIGSIGLAGCQSVGFERRPAGHRLDDASRRRNVKCRARARRDTRAADSDRRRARRRPRRAGRLFADGRRPPGGVAGAGGGARFGSEALVARGQRRIRLCRARGRDGRRLPRLFANHLCRRPAKPRPRRRLQTGRRKLEDDELRLRRMGDPRRPGHSSTRGWARQTHSSPKCLPRAKYTDMLP